MLVRRLVPVRLLVCFIGIFAVCVSFVCTAHAQATSTEAPTDAPAAPNLASTQEAIEMR